MKTKEQATAEIQELKTMLQQKMGADKRFVLIFLEEDGVISLVTNRISGQRLSGTLADCVYMVGTSKPDFQKPHEESYDG